MNPASLARAALTSTLVASIFLTGCDNSTCPEGQKMGSACVAAQDGGNGDAQRGDAGCVDPQLFCPLREHASATCTQGACSFACNGGYEDCDEEAQNGCEADLQSRAHCGGCNVQCDTSLGQYCAGSTCREALAAGAVWHGGPSHDALDASVSDDSGNRILAGTFDAMDFGGHPLVQRRTKYPEDHVYDVSTHVVSLTPTGAVRWAWTINAVDAHRREPALVLHRIDIDITGDIYVAGTIRNASSVVLLRYGLEVEVPVVNPRPDGDIIVLRLREHDGMLRWATRLSSQSEESVSALAVTPDRVYVGGSFRDGSFPLGALGGESSEATKRDGFIARFDQTLQAARFDRAMTFGGPGDDWVQAAHIGGVPDPFNETFTVGGVIEGAVRINTTELGTRGSLAPSGFVARLGPKLATQAATAFGGPKGTSSVTDLTTSPQGLTYAVGTFDGTVDFGTSSLTSTGAYDGYVVRLDDDLQLRWAQALPGPSTGNPREARIVVAADEDSVFLAGTAPLKLSAQEDGFAPDRAESSMFLMGLRGDTGAGQWVRGWAQSSGAIAVTELNASMEDRLWLTGEAFGSWNLTGSASTTDNTDIWTLDVFY